MDKSNLGLCCQYLDGGKNILKISSLQLGRYNRGLYSTEKIYNTYRDNLNNLINNLDRVFSEGYTLFRFPSGIFPLFDRVPEDLWNNGEIIGLLRQIGDLVRRYKVRATFHPGQYCSLSSDSIEVVVNSVREIEHHAWIFDQMGLEKSPHYAINVHGGKGDREDNLIRGIFQLNESARSRLTLENCETAYNVGQLYRIYNKTGIPIVWDSHHHIFNDGGMGMEDAMLLAAGTWGEVKPLQHISNSRNPEGTFQKRRAHSDYIEKFPGCQMEMLKSGDVQIDIEAKMKNLSIDRILDEWK